MAADSSAHNPRDTPSDTGSPKGRLPDPDPLETLEHARAAASELVEDLRAELVAIGESTEASPDDEHDAEGSTVGYERARVTSLLEQAQRRLAEIETAWGRLQAGVYGTCESCGAEISDERLAALPTAVRCSRCAAAQPAVRWRRPNAEG